MVWERHISCLIRLSSTLERSQMGKAELLAMQQMMQAAFGQRCGFSP